jgi:hypothetical protein
MSALPDVTRESSVRWIDKKTKRVLKNQPDFSPIYNYGIVLEETKINHAENTIRLRLREKELGRHGYERESEFCIRFGEESRCFCKSDFWEEPGEEYEAKCYNSSDSTLILYEDEWEAIYIILK